MWGLGVSAASRIWTSVAWRDPLSVSGLDQEVELACHRGPKERPHVMAEVGLERKTGWACWEFTFDERRVDLAPPRGGLP